MQLPTVTSCDSTDTSATIAIALSADLPAFAGHFPGTPILPGVVQIDWAIRFAHEYLKIPQTSATNFRVKYNRIISPGMNLVLFLQLENNKLDFTYQVKGEQMSSGQIKL